jgi:hypothetical protein
VTLPAWVAVAALVVLDVCAAYIVWTAPDTANPEEN